MARRPRRPPRPGALSELRPLRILTQIAVLQAIWYAAAIVLQFFNCIASGMCFSFRDLVLGWEAVRGDTTQGFVVGMGWVLDGGVVM